MTIQAKKYRDVATQITVFPKFSRQGLFDVSTQVTSKEIQRDPKLRSLPNGTTIIQNSIVNQSESTIILNAGSESEMILHKCTICGKVTKINRIGRGISKFMLKKKYTCVAIVERFTPVGASQLTSYPLRAQTDCCV